MSSSTSSRPQLKGRPDLNPAARLAALDQWSKEPAANALPPAPAPIEVVEPPPPAVAAVPTPAPAPVQAVAPQGYPWVGVEGGRAYSIILPADLYIQLKWLGEMTFGDSMRKFVTRTLRAAATEELKKRGINYEPPAE